jgi:tripartite-type tricarboxylate transporter receptor subunit TctC
MDLGKRELAAAMLLGSAVPLAAASAGAEPTYPQRPITLVVGYPVGGATDTLARLLGQHMAEVFGQRVIIENRAGAASNIAAQSVARTPPDGYTLFLSSRPNTLHKTLYAGLDYDFAKDLAPVALVATMPTVIITGPDASISSVGDLIARAKNYPGTLTCASSGFGTTGHLLCELFQEETQVSLEHIPYKGSAPALNDPMAGRVDVQFDALPATIGQIRAGSVRLISAISRRRLAVAKDVPTARESGLATVDVEDWAGIMVPTGTPATVIARLNACLNAVLMRPELQSAFIDRGYVAPVAPNTPETFRTLIGQENARWAPLLQRRTLKPVSQP